MAAALTWALGNWRLIAVAAVLALLGLQTVRLADQRTDTATARKDLADYKAAQQEARILADRAQRTEEQRRAAAVAQEASDAQTRISALEDDVRRAGAAADGVRDAAAGAASRARARACPAATGPGQPGDDPIGLLVDVLGRVDQRAGELAEYADRLRIAGVACERSYDALGSGRPLPRE